MLIPMVAALGACLVFQDAPPAKPPVAPPVAQRTSETPFSDALKKTLAAKSYAFESTNATVRGDAPAGDDAPARAGGGDEVKVTGAVQQGAPMHVQRGALEAYLKDHQMAFRRGDGAQAIWESFDPNSPGSNVPGGGGGGGAGGAGGGAERPHRKRGGDPAGGDGKTPPSGGTPQGKPDAPVGGGAVAAGGGAPAGAMLRRSLTQVATVVAPHELLATLAAQSIDVQRQAVGETVVFHGTLTPAGAELVSGAAEMKRLAAQTGRAGAAQSYAGTFDVTLGSDGLVTTIAVDTTVTSGNRGARAHKLTCKLTGFDSTKYVVPNEAIGLLPK